MTINQLLRQSNVPFTRKDAIIISNQVKELSQKRKLRYTKKEELVLVNDYPKELEEEMITIAIEYFKTKNSKK